MALLEGTDGPDVLVGAAEADVLVGGAGADSLDGGGGADRMEGGAGDDAYFVDTLDDAVVELDGGGTDRLVIALSRSAYFTYHTIGENIEDVLVLSGEGLGVLGNDRPNTFTIRSSFGYFDGAGGDDDLYGSPSYDKLYGGPGNDLLHDGGAGMDEMGGGAGDDVYVVAGDTISFVFELGSQGIDRVDAWLSFTLGNEVEDLRLMGEAADGTGNYLNNAITGNAAANRLRGEGGDDVLIGMAGDDVLIGGEGSDQLQGGAGNDVLDGADGTNWTDRLEGGDGDDAYVADGGDVIVEGEFGGIDHVEGHGDVTLPDWVENLTLRAGDDPLNGTGNALANRIVGNDGHNVLAGDGGADTLVGGGGDDFYVIDRDDTVVELPGGGTDVIAADHSLTLAPEFEDLFLRGGGAMRGTGNNGANFLVGNAGRTVLRGLGGNDWIEGGAGRDKLQGGAGRDVLTADRGHDALRGGSGSDEFRFKAGRGTVLDFRDDADTLAFDDAFWGGGAISAEDFLDGYATLGRSGAVFDFGGGDVLVVKGVTDLGSLSNDLAWF